MLTGLQFVIIDLTCCLLTLALLLLRLKLYYNTYNRLQTSDYFAIGGWLVFLSIVIQDWLVYSLGAFNGKFDPSATVFAPENPSLATHEETITILKVYYSSGIIYYSQMYCCKASMLALYATSLFPPFMKKLRVSMWVTCAITFLGWFSTLLVKILACVPIKKNWSLGDEDHCNTAIDGLSSYVRWGPHLLTDILIYILPMFMLKHLKLSLWQKAGVASTFAAGFICIATACINQLSWFIHMDPAPSFLCSTMEMTWAMIVVCLPAMKKLFRRGTTIRRHRRAQYYVSSSFKEVFHRGEKNSITTQLSGGGGLIKEDTFFDVEERGDNVDLQPDISIENKGTVVVLPERSLSLDEDGQR